MAFQVGKTEQELMTQRANTLREIEARGGRAKAPSFAARLDQIDSALRAIRSNAPQQPATPAAQPAAPAQAAPAAGFTLGTDEASLMQQRANAMREIEARGGKDKAPNFAQRLEQIDGALRNIRKGGAAAPNPAQPTAPVSTPTPPVNPAADPAPLAAMPKEITDLPTAMAAEKAVADASAKGQISYGNAAAESNAFGTKTVEFDANGRPVVKESLTPEQQQILDQQQQLSQTGGQAAQQIISQGGLGQSFAPNLDQRVTQGDLLGFRQKQQQDLEQYLTRDFQRDKARDLNALETSLYNRGIPLDRQAEAYDRAIEGLNRDYDARYASAAAQALQFGNQEAQTTFDMNEGVRAAQLREQQITRGQNLSDAQTLSTLGTGVIVPQFNPFQGGNYTLQSPTAVQTELNAAQIAAKQQKAQEKLINAQAAAANRPKTGNTGTVAQSPFVEG